MCVLQTVWTNPIKSFCVSSHEKLIIRLPSRQIQDAVSDHIFHDLGGTSFDRVRSRAQIGKYWLGAEEFGALWPAERVVGRSADFRSCKLESQPSDLLVELSEPNLRTRSLRGIFTGGHPLTEPDVGNTKHLRIDPCAAYSVVKSIRGVQVALCAPFSAELSDHPRFSGKLTDPVEGALGLQGGHRHGPTTIDLPDGVTLAHKGVAEKNLVELGLPSDLPQGLDLHARLPHVYQEVGESIMRSAFGRGPGEQDGEIGLVCQRRPDLVPADTPSILDFDRAGTDRREIGAGIRLTEELAAHQFSRPERPDQISLLLVGAGEHQRGDGLPDIDVDRQRIIVRGAGPIESRFDSLLCVGGQSQTAQPFRLLHHGETGIEAGVEELKPPHSSKVMTLEEVIDERVNSRVVRVDMWFHTHRPFQAKSGLA